MKELEKKYEYTKAIVESSIEIIESEYTEEEIVAGIAEIFAIWFCEPDFEDSILSAYPELENEIEEVADYLRKFASNHINEKYFS